MHSILNSVISKLSDSFILINKEKEIIFQSDSYKKLVCSNHENLGLCDAFLLPALSLSNGKNCCWDAIENYKKSNENALWQIRNHKNIQTVLCKLETINIGDSPAFIGLKIEPVMSFDIPIAKSFFNNLYYSLGNKNTYKETVCKYFREHYFIGYVNWLSLTSKHLNKLEQKIMSVISEYKEENIYDIVVEHNKSSKIFHVFRGSDDSFLVIGNVKKKLDIHLVNVLQTSINILDTEKEEFSIVFEKQLKQSMFLELLTNIEKEILTYLQEGLSDIEIAQKRAVSINTIKNQIRSMMKKAGVNKRIKMIILSFK